MALQASQVSMREIAEAIFRNKWIFLLCLLVGVTGGWLRAARLPRLYRAETALRAQDRDDSNPTVKNIGVTTPLPKRVSEVQDRVLSDQNGLAELARDLKVSDYRTENPGAAGAALKNSALFSLKGSLLTISVTRSGPGGGEDAAKIANGLAERMVALSREVGIDRATSNTLELSRLRAEYQDRLTSAELQLQRFESINNVDLRGSAAELAQSVKGLGYNQPDANSLIAQFQDLANRRVTNEIQLEGLRSRLIDIDRQITEEPEYRTVEVVQARHEVQNDVEKAYARVQGELAVLRDAGRSDLHPTVRAKLAEAETLRTQVDALEHPVVQQEKRQVNDVLASLRIQRSKVTSEIAELESTQERLRASVERLGERVRELPEKEARRRHLQIQVDIQQGILKDLNSRYEHADLSSVLESKVGAPLFSVVAQAATPPAPFSPNTKFILLMGGFIGAIVGMVFSFVREMLDTSFRNLEDASRYLDLPVLGVIPEVIATRRHAATTRRTRRPA